MTNQIDELRRRAERALGDFSRYEMALALRLMMEISEALPTDLERRSNIVLSREGVEIWKPCPDYEDIYAVSNLGRVKRIADSKTRKAGGILLARSKTARYPLVQLFREGTGSTLSVHRLVAEAFLGPCPDGLEVNHKDGNTRNNCLFNLEYVTHAENVKHSIEILGNTRGPRGEKSGSSKLTREQVKEIRALYSKKKITQQELADRYGVSSSNISCIIRRESWKHI